MPSHQSEKIAIRDLFRGGCCPHFSHAGRWYSIRPELVFGSCGAQQQKSICGRLGWPGSARQLCADANDSKLRHCARRPSLTNCVSREPLHRRVVMLVLGDKQRHQYVHVQKADHGSDYSPTPSARRSTSSTERVGAPGRRGNTGTPRSKRISAFAIRLSSASTNSSTRCPDWLARSASRSFKAASTVIVAFGIRHCPTRWPPGQVKPS